MQPVRLSFSHGLYFTMFLMMMFSCKQEHPTTNEQPTPSAIVETARFPHLMDSILAKYQISDSSNQIILSYNMELSATTGQLLGYEKINNQWQLTFDTIAVNFGKNGFAPYDKKMEGDGKSPTGVFEIGSAFGYVDNIPHKMNFLKMNENHYWDSDPKSITYNQLLSEKPEISKTGEVEEMRRKDDLYKYGIIIEYNTKPAVSGKGSAIFLHTQRNVGAHTAGCISMAEQDIIRLIHWIKPNSNPMIAMGTWSALK
jgi:L,D-peptidoglycan transpeptidase YkuD (ErfK/YbiS/YcfS/YnhG family)